MATILMYNPSNQHMHELDDTNTDAQARMGESGFRRVERFDLVAIYHPGLNAHKTVLRADLPSWLNQGYYAEPTYVYHPDEGKRLVSADEAKHLYQNGWYDSPAKFSDAAKTALVDAAAKEALATQKAGGKKPAAA